MGDVVGITCPECFGRWGASACTRCSPDRQLVRVGTIEWGGDDRGFYLNLQGPFGFEEGAAVYVEVTGG